MAIDNDAAEEADGEQWAIAALIIGGLIVFSLISNAVDGDSDGGSAPTESSSDVDWENYAPEVKTRIDSLAASGDCAALQREFDIADANDALQRDRVGEGNADLMGYIDDKLTSAGCYG